VIRGARIVQQVPVATSREDLFTWFADAERLATWMGDSARLELEPGGVFSCRLPAGQVWDGLVVEVEPPLRLVVTLGWRNPSSEAAQGMAAGMTLVEWDFAPDKAGSRLRLTHQYVPTPLLGPLNETWARLLARLRNVIAGRPAGPHPLAELHPLLQPASEPAPSESAPPQAEPS
jgi:uncharacterized protein YndB with AHSA1/START domain